MPPGRDLFCHACGTAFPSPHAYPRACPNPACRALVWANPIPVAVTLAPVAHGGRTGLLVVRRGIEPGRGKLALVGGFIEEHEPWQVAAAREIREEVQVEIDVGSIALVDCVSTEPRPNRILIFATCAQVASAGFAPFVANPESLARGVIFGPDGLDGAFAFTLHAAAARRWFHARGLTGGLDYVDC